MPDANPEAPRTAGSREFGNRRRIRPAAKLDFRADFVDSAPNFPGSDRIAPAAPLLARLPPAHMLVFSTCWNSHRHTEGKHMVSELRLLGFDCAEISHGTSVALFPGILTPVDRGKFSVAGVHNYCPSPVEITIDAPDCYEITSHRDDERRRAISLTKRSIDTAVRFGGHYVVMHLGRTPIRGRTRCLEERVSKGALNSRAFVRDKLAFIQARESASALAMERIRTALRELIPYAAENGVQLALESRSHFEQAPSEREMLALLEEFESPWVGYWHDFGHVERKANLGLLDHAEWLESVRHRLIGCHLHDVNWPADDHEVPFRGTIDFDRLVPLLPKSLPIVWEMNPRRRSAHIKESLVQWREKYGEFN